MHLPPRLRAADARARRRQGRELRQADRVVRRCRRTQDADRSASKRRGRGGEGRPPPRRPRPPTEGGDLPIEVATGEVIRPISPYVYGINSQPDEGAGATVRRMGGNRQTALQLGAQRLQRRQRLQPPERRLALHGARLHATARPGRAVLDFAQANRRGGHGDGGDGADGRLRHRRQARAGPRGRQGAQQALGQVGRAEAGPASPPRPI